MFLFTSPDGTYATGVSAELRPQLTVNLKGLSTFDEAKIDENGSKDNMELVLLWVNITSYSNLFNNLYSKGGSNCVYTDLCYHFLDHIQAELKRS